MANRKEPIKGLRLGLDMALRAAAARNFDAKARATLNAYALIEPDPEAGLPTTLDEVADLIPANIGAAA